MDYYAIKAKEKERQIIRKLKGSIYFTGSGKKNIIENITNDAIYVRTKKSKVPFRISRIKLREGIRHLLYKRTVTRRELESFSNFSSALMGLLRYLFLNEGIVKIAKTAKGLLRLSLKGIRVFFSGVDRSPGDLQLAHEHGARFVLMSYHFLREDTNENWKYHIKRLGFKVLLDSGAFSVYSAQLKGEPVTPIRIEEYIRFIKKHQDVLYHWMNLDVIGDPVKTRENFERLKGEGLTPIPVWTASEESFEELDRIVKEDDYPVIAVGGTVFLSEVKRKRIFDRLFETYPDINFHGLGVSSQALYNYDFFSSDSTVWLGPRKYGRILTSLGQIQSPREWSLEECLAWNVELLSQMEEQYEKPIQLDILVPPVLKYKEIALF